jgi:eukaryotic-like serine/threonine-protein kinase
MDRQASPMTAERWAQVKRVFDAAHSKAPEERAELVRAMAEGDQELESEVRDLLAADESAAGFLQTPAADLHSPGLAPGARLGPYQILGLLGEGGMGKVYRGLDTRLGRAVAVKICAEQFSKRFEQEARAISALNHPNICTLYDVGPHYLVTELVEGETLRDWLRREPTVERRLETARQILEALRAAHCAGIVHRDLKPQNIMVRFDGYVKVLDFGLAKQLPAARSVQRETDALPDASLPGQILGTIAYMSPEQIQGHPVDQRSDLFSLGIILFEMFTGQHPWPRESPVDTLHAILHDDPPAMNATATGTNVAPIVRKLLAKNPAERYPLAEGVLEALSSCTDPQGSSAATAADRKAPSRGRNRWIFASAILLLVALAAGAYLFLLHDRRANQAGLEYTQLTDFTDSATGPALSPDGHMVAFIRGSTSFLSADQVYVKLLPNGEARLLTDDRRLKYGLAFSPDGSQIAYTAVDSYAWLIYTVSVLGGDPHLFLSNAAGLTWLDQNQLLFSEVRSRVHMGVVTGTITRGNFRELYFPLNERGMAHYSYASPDQRSALVVEMDGIGEWARCRLISLDGRSQTRPIGPNGACTAAGWSPDGSWMYFTAVVEGRSHLWRQRFPDGQPEQITFGPTEEEGVAVERDGRSIITAMGVKESAIWIHDADGERSLSSEGEVVNGVSTLVTPGLGDDRPSFSGDDKILYYLLRHQPTGSGAELWRMMVDSGKSEAVFPSVSMLAYDVSPDGRQAVYATAGSDGKSHLWIAPMDRNSPAKPIGLSGERSPHFGPRGQILFQFTEGSLNYLEQMNQDGSGRSRVVPYPILFVKGISPGRRWVMAAADPDGKGRRPVAISVEGGPPQTICDRPCDMVWSSNGKFLFIPVEPASRTSAGRSLAIPIGPGESLPKFPPGGIRPLADTSVMPGSRLVNRADLVPGRDLSHFAYVNTTVHRNLYRISLP